MLQIADEARLIDRTDRPDAHRARGKLPEVGHQPRVRIARETACTGARCTQLTSIVLKITRIEPALKKSARIDARGGMRLHVDQVPCKIRLARPEEVVKPGLEEISSRRIAGDMPTKLGMSLIRPNDHRQRIPAHQCRQLPLTLQVPGECGLIGCRDGVDVRRRGGRPPAHTDQVRVLLQGIKQEARTLRATFSDDRG